MTYPWYDLSFKGPEHAILRYDFDHKHGVSYQNYVWKLAHHFGNSLKDQLTLVDLDIQWSKISNLYITKDRCDLDILVKVNVFICFSSIPRSQISIEWHGQLSINPLHNCFNSTQILTLLAICMHVFHFEFKVMPRNPLKVKVKI